MTFPEVRHGSERPIVSVISVVRNDPDGLARTLASLQSAGPEFEVVVVEGSSPESGHAAEQLRRFEGQADTCLIVGQDSGPYDAMNRGILGSDGDWLWFVNAGDEVAPGFNLRELSTTLRDTTSSWAVGEVVLKDDSSCVINRVASVEQILSGEASQCHQGTLIHRRAMMAVGLFDTRLRIAADYKMMCQVAMRGSPTTLEGPVAVFYRGGLSSVRRRRLHAEMFAIRLSLGRHSARWYGIDLVRTLKRIAMDSRQL